MNYSQAVRKRKGYNYQNVCVNEIRAGHSVDSLLIGPMAKE